MKPIILLSALVALAPALRATVTETFKQTYPLAAEGTVQLESINGFVEIEAWNRNEVSVEAEKSAKDAEGLSRMHILVESGPTRLKIKSDYDQKWKFWDTMNAEVRYKIKVPAGASLDKIEVVNSGVHVSGVHGSITLEGVNGSFAAEDVAGVGWFKTVNGSISVKYSKLTTGSAVTIASVNGDCKLTLPSDAVFRLEAGNLNGHINCAFPITLEKSSSHDLRGTVGGGGAVVKLESVNGALSVARSD